jgi:F0F1-type ATP synthase membrane subunit b/b'
MRRFNIDPAYAPMIAAGRVAEEKIADALMKANELRPQTTPITPAAQRAWMKLKKELGNEAMLTRGSAREAAEAAVKAMADEAEKLLENPSVRLAYEKFLFVAELTKEHTNGT